MTVQFLYAFIADGEDSFCAMTIDNEHFPMVCAGHNDGVLKSMKRTAMHIATMTGRPIRLMKFTVPEEIEVFVPAGVPHARQ